MMKFYLVFKESLLLNKTLLRSIGQTYYYMGKHFRVALLPCGTARVPKYYGKRLVVKRRV